jgi:hypothetical protein
MLKTSLDGCLRLSLQVKIGKHLVAMWESSHRIHYGHVNFALHCCRLMKQKELADNIFLTADAFAVSVVVEISSESARFF